MYHKSCFIALLAAGMLAVIPGARAQDSGAQADKPLPPDSLDAKGQNAQKGSAEPFPVDEPKVTPDTRPLAGAQVLTLGTTEKTRDFVLPSFSVVSQIQRGRYLPNASKGLGTVANEFAAARLALNHVKPDSSLLFEGAVGGSFSNDSSIGNSLIGTVSSAYALQRGRWTTTLGDQFSYTAAALFGYGGLGGLGSLGVGLGNGVGTSPGFAPNFVPNQTLFLNGASRFSNSVIAQEDYALTHRASLTFAGAYQLLKFIDVGFQDGDSEFFQGGYNYALTRKDGISLAYQFSRFAYFSAVTKVLNHGAVFSYARRLTGRMSFQIGAGPEVQTYQGVGEKRPSLVWTSYGNLTYELGRTGITASYSHAPTGGSGLFLGAQTDSAFGSLTRTLNNNWVGIISGGYSRNQTLRQTTLFGNAAPQSWFATSQINRRFVRFGNLSLTYGFAHQSNLTGFCTLPQCSPATNTHTLSIGYTWGLRPLEL